MHSRYRRMHSIIQLGRAFYQPRERGWENYGQTSKSIYIDSDAFHGLMGFRWANYARKARLSPTPAPPPHPPPSSGFASIEDQFGMSDVRVSLRRFHRGPNNSSHPFRNAYKSRDSVATEGNQGAAKRLAGGGKGWDGAKRETKGFDRGLPCCRMKDATTWKTVAARVHALPSPSPSPLLLPSKGLLFIIQSIQSFKLWKTGGSDSRPNNRGPLYSLRIRSVTSDRFFEIAALMISYWKLEKRFEKEKMFWKQSVCPFFFYQ